MGWGSFRDKVTGKAGKEASRFVEHGGVSIGGTSLQDRAEGAYADLSGKTAAEAAEEAAAVEEAAQMDELAYYKKINELPQQYKEEALTELRNMAFEPGAQDSFISRVKQSPLYTQIMGGKAAGEEAVMRHSSQTGGLRSGNVNEALYDYNVGLEKEAFTTAYGEEKAGIERLAGLRTNEQQIGQTMGDIGTTRAQGILGAAQSRRQGTSNLVNTVLGIGGLIL